MLRAAGSSAEARAVAERALGVASRDLGAPRRAVAHLEASVALACAAGSAQREGEARVSLTLAYMRIGESRRALREWERAAAVPGVDRGRLFLNRAVIFQRLGRDQDALDDFDTALNEIRNSPNGWAEARVLSNRGVLLAYKGDFEAALADLERARTLHLELGADIAAAEVLHNIGFALARQGDLPGALARYDEASAAFRALGLARSEPLTDRCELLIDMGLWPEARATAESAIEGSEAMGRFVDAAEARLMLARVCLLQADFAAAGRIAEQARLELAQQRRHSWSLLASFVALQARVAGSAVPDTVIAREARRMARRLDRAGWSVAALESLLLAATVSLARGELAAARASLAEVAAARRGGPAPLRVRAWHAEAMLRAAAGDAGGAFRALRAGLRVVDEHRESLGATELRVRSKAVGSDLAELGVTLALASADPAQVFDWVERWRASTLAPGRLRPPRDPEVVRLLGALRETVSRARRATLAGRDAAAELRRQRVLEASIRRREHAAPGSPMQGAGRRTAEQAGGRETMSSVRAALGDELGLVQLASIGDALSAVIVTDRSSHLVHLGDMATIERERASQLFALGRLARRRGDHASLQAAAAELREASARLDRLLGAPLVEIVGARDIVLVPTGELHSVVWSLLPTLAGRPVTVAPSATVWADRRRTGQGTRSPAPSKDVLLVAAPDVQNGRNEIDVLRHRFYRRASELSGDAAGAAAVLQAIEGKSLVHMAVHGEFRRDSPLFSSMSMADGPLTVFELEELRSAPELIVLSACDLGLTHAPAGGEPIGPVAALLGVGTGTVLASVAPVPDDGVAEFVVELHDCLARGIGPARALAEAQRRCEVPSLTALATGSPEVGREVEVEARAVAAAGFVCFGRG